MVSTLQTFLWIGTSTIIIKDVIAYLQKYFCANNQCGHCSVCLLIENYEHPCILWLKPQPTYTLETLKPFFALISRTVDPQQKFFFIFEDADYLSTACANSLLKSIEEPPPGFEIIFLARTIQNVVPTLRSRCIVVSKNNTENREHSTLANFFVPNKNYNVQEFLEFLSRHPIDEQISMAALRFLLDIWSSYYKEKILIDYDEATKAHKKISLISQSLDKPIMPGSGKLFWKNFFLEFYDYVQ